MATLKEFRDSYHELSGAASEVSRQLGFAGIAVIWIFKADSPEKAYTLAPELYHAGVAIVLSLALDLLHYVFGSLIWGAFWRSKEKGGASDSQEITATIFQLAGDCVLLGEVIPYDCRVLLSAKVLAWSHLAHRMSRPIPGGPSSLGLAAVGMVSEQACAPADQLAKAAGLGLLYR